MKIIFVFCSSCYCCKQPLSSLMFLGQSYRQYQLQSPLLLQQHVLSPYNEFSKGSSMA
ncbi:hypothetical protein EE612_028711 [Oryza sativa]|nr:hypothetical protein EE612_028711 [Oryza sativa]